MKDKYYELSSDSIEVFMEIFEKKSFPIGLKIQFIGSSKQKSLIQISKISEQFSFLLKKDILVSINEDQMSLFDEESITILIEQEVDKIVVNVESGAIKLIKPDLSTFSALVNKYGVDKVARANKVEELYTEQRTDADSEFIV